MAKKKNNNNNNSQAQQQQNESNGGGEKEVQKKEGGGGGDSKKGGNDSDGSIVLKIEMHCEGCASKVLKLARSFKGVESVKADIESKKLTVMGKVDPSQIRDFLQQKTKKKVDLLSPLPKKEDSAKNAKNNKDQNNRPNDDKSGAAADNKKPKEAPVTTAVIKVAFHCLGCIEKIHKIVFKTQGVHDMTLDKQKETVTVKGTMDVKALTETLKDRLKRPVEIIPPKKEKDGENASAGGGGDNSGGGKKKKGGGGEGQENAGNGGGGEFAVAKMEQMMQPGFGYGTGPMPGYGYMGQPNPMAAYGHGFVGQAAPGYGNGYYMGMTQGPPVPVYDYGYGYGNQVPGYPVHMKFNDENPNACSVM